MVKSIVYACLFCILTAMPAWADTGWEKYGITHTPDQREEAEDQAYGGYPNNKDFNSDTKCSKAARLFNVAHPPGPSNPEMAAFLSFSSMKLAEMDTLKSNISHTPSIIDKIGVEKFKALPAMYGNYCRHHPETTLDQATSEIYNAAQNSLQ